MKILAVGGGSGGHVTPVVAVLKEIRATRPRAEIRFWCDRAFAPQAKLIVGELDASIPISVIAAGKLRRYHHLTFLQQLSVPKLLTSNIVDGFKVAAGFIQSFFKIIMWRPDVVFTKGGYVCLPVGLAAHILRIPLVIHDSDAHPGLTNRILARFARFIATGAPLEFYPYPASKTTYVGIPIDARFAPHTDAQKRAAKQEWGFVASKPLVVVTGGGLGAQRLNDAVLNVRSRLEKYFSVALVTGSSQYDSARALVPEDSESFKVYPFVSTMHSLLGAADIVVARAGATTILELAALAMPTVLVPNARLTGGHQVKNAAVYETSGAVKLLSDDELEASPESLLKVLRDITEQDVATKQMTKQFQSFARPDAAKDMAQMVLRAAK